jgi:hypothetical protein
MPRRLIPLLALCIAFVAACGGAEVQSASSTTDVNTLLSDTFRNLGKVKSANLTAKLAIDGQGESVSATLNGPFQSQGAGKLPKFQLDATLNSAGRSFTAGATWTGDKGFVNLQGTQYALTGLVAQQLEAGYEQAVKSGQGQGKGAAGALLGIDFSKWLKDARNEGAADVGGTPAIKLTGEADVAQVVDDVQRIAERAGSLGLPGAAQVPQKLSPQQRQEIVGAVKRFALEIYTGRDDRILRRLVVAADIADPASKKVSHLAFDLSLSDVGSDQHFTEPENARPFSELQKAIGGLTGHASSPKTSSAGIQKYTKCVERAKGDVAKSQKCAALLGG